MKISTPPASNNKRVENTLSFWQSAAAFTALLAALLPFAAAAMQTKAQTKPPFHVLAFHSMNVESDHIEFAKGALAFYHDLASRERFDFRDTTNWDDLLHLNPSQDRLVLWLDDFPHTTGQRTAFETYMKNGGGWLGFHIAAYNDRDTHWPWFVSFLGGAVFYGNNWPPLPATLTVDDTETPVTRGLPASFTAPANEWYSWKPNPRSSSDIKVLLTLARSNYPLGFKDTLTGGDVPVVWTNTRYRMLYVNMGHGDKIFTNPTQNKLLTNALLWLRNRV